MDFYQRPVGLRWCQEARGKVAAGWLTVNTHSHKQKTVTMDSCYKCMSHGHLAACSVNVPPFPLFLSFPFLSFPLSLPSPFLYLPLSPLSPSLPLSPPSLLSLLSPSSLSLSLPLSPLSLPPSYLSLPLISPSSLSLSLPSPSSLSPPILSSLPLLSSPFRVFSFLDIFDFFTTRLRISHVENLAIYSWAD